MHRAPRAYTLGEARTVYLSHEQRFRFTQKAQVGGGGVWLFEDEEGGRGRWWSYAGWGYVVVWLFKNIF